MILSFLFSFFDVWCRPALGHSHQTGIKVLTLMPPGTTLYASSINLVQKTQLQGAKITRSIIEQHAQAVKVSRRMNTKHTQLDRYHTIIKTVNYTMPLQCIWKICLKKKHINAMLTIMRMPFPRWMSFPRWSPQAESCTCRCSSSLSTRERRRLAASNTPPRQTWAARYCWPCDSYMQGFLPAFKGLRPPLSVSQTFEEIWVLLCNEP